MIIHVQHCTNKYYEFYQTCLFICLFNNSKQADMVKDKKHNSVSAYGAVAQTKQPTSEDLIFEKSSADVFEARTATGRRM